MEFVLLSFAFRVAHSGLKQITGTRKNRGHLQPESAAWNFLHFTFTRMQFSQQMNISNAVTEFLICCRSVFHDILLRRRFTRFFFVARQTASSLREHYFLRSLLGRHSIHDAKVMLMVLFQLLFTR